MHSWTYNELKHIGVDFDDPQQVETYEARQKTDIDVERNLVARLGIKREHSVLEYGPGTGAFAIAAGKAGATVLGIDISQTMLNFASKRAKGSGLNKVEFRKGGYLTQELELEGFDFAVTKFTLHHLPDFWKIAALRRVWNYLKPTGKLYIQDVVFSFQPDAYHHELEAWIEAAIMGGSFSRKDLEMHIRDEFSTYGILMENILRLAGFRIEVANYYSKTQAEYICGKATAEYSTISPVSP